VAILSSDFVPSNDTSFRRDSVCAIREAAVNEQKEVRVRHQKDYSKPFIPDPLISLILPAESSFPMVSDAILIFADSMPEGLLSVAHYRIGEESKCQSKRPRRFLAGAPSLTPLPGWCKSGIPHSAWGFLQKSSWELGTTERDGHHTQQRRKVLSFNR
jgi:hypothetical protein